MKSFCIVFILTENKHKTSKKGKASYSLITSRLLFDEASRNKSNPKKQWTESKQQNKGYKFLLSKEFIWDISWNFTFLPSKHKLHICNLWRWNKWPFNCPIFLNFARRLEAASCGWSSILSHTLHESLHIALIIL